MSKTYRLREWIWKMLMVSWRGQSVWDWTVPHCSTRPGILTGRSDWGLEVESGTWTSVKTYVFTTLCLIHNQWKEAMTWSYCFFSLCVRGASLLQFALTVSKSEMIPTFLQSNASRSIVISFLDIHAYTYYLNRKKRRWITAGVSPTPTAEWVVVPGSGLLWGQCPTPCSNCLCSSTTQFRSTDQTALLQ